MKKDHAVRLRDLASPYRRQITLPAIVIFTLAGTYAAWNYHHNIADAPFTLIKEICANQLRASACELSVRRVAFEMNCNRIAGVELSGTTWIVRAYCSNKLEAILIDKAGVMAVDRDAR